jgi:hypothetical protein
MRSIISPLKEVFEETTFFWLVKNAQMQGPRNHEARGVLKRTPQQRKMRETPQMGVFHQAVNSFVQLAQTG